MISDSVIKCGRLFFLLSILFLSSCSNSGVLDSHLLFLHPSFSSDSLITEYEKGCFAVNVGRAGGYYKLSSDIEFDGADLWDYWADYRYHVYLNIYFGKYYTGNDRPPRTDCIELGFEDISIKVVGGIVEISVSPSDSINMWTVLTHPNDKWDGYASGRISISQIPE